MIRWRWLAAVGAVVAAVWWLRVEVVDSVGVLSDSMKPTFCQGDQLLVLRAGVARDAERGDLVTFTDAEGASTLKRIVAVGGQSVEMRDAVLYVDDHSVDEPFVDLDTIDGTYFGPETVPADAVFVLGDEREYSIDSRHYGPVDRDALTGRVLVRLWSGCG